MNKFDSPAYKRSRNAYTIMCAFEYFISLLITDAFLAKLLSSIGISDSMVGIISSFVTLAFVFQLATIFVVKVKASYKKLVITFFAISDLSFMFLYVVPFLPVGKNLKTLLVIVLILFAYLCKYLVSTIHFKWANAYVEPSKRASFSAVKEIISLFLGIIFTSVLGYVMDRYESMDNLSGAFLFNSIAIFILTICNFVSLSLIKEEDASEHEGANEPFSVVLKNTLGNKNFRSIVYMGILWNVANYFIMGFMGIFKTKDLMISVFAVQIINIISSVVRMMVTKPFGRYSDMNSYAKGIKLGMYFAVLSFAAIMFTKKSTWYFVIAHAILYNCANAGIGQNSTNITYSYIDIKYVTQAMAIKNCIGGLCGFGASLLAGKILDLIQANGNMIFGIHMYGQQVLAAISLVITVLTIVYINAVIEKQQVMVQ